MVIFGYVLINLFTGVIIEIFYLRANLANFKVNVSQMQLFVKVWKDFDSEGKGFIHWTEALTLLYQLKLPLGVDEKIKTPIIINYYFQQLKLPLYKSFEDKKLYIHAYDMLLALIKSSLKQEAAYKKYPDVSDRSVSRTRGSEST